jgi:hypothetical protein
VRSCSVAMVSGEKVRVRVREMYRMTIFILLLINIGWRGFERNWWFEGFGIRGYMNSEMV